jgi:hypothetical protein
VPYRVDRGFAGHAMKPAFGAESKPNSEGWTFLLFGIAVRACAPPLAFVTGASVVNLCTGAAFAAGLSLVLLAIQRWRRASMRSPLIGLLLTLATCSLDLQGVRHETSPDGKPTHCPVWAGVAG